MVSPPTRPALLSIGILLNALHAAFMMGVTALVFAVMAGASGASALTGQLEAIWPLSILMGLGAFFFALFAFFYALILYACWSSWTGSRGWTWALVILSGIGLVNSGPISIAIGLCTIFGGLQFLGVIGAGDRVQD